MSKEEERRQRAAREGKRKVNEEREKENLDRS